MLLTFQRHGLQNAELFENSHKQNDDHSDGKQLHSLNTHGCDELRLLAQELLELLEVKVLISALTRDKANWLL